MSKMRFVKSAVLPKDYPEADRPEIAVAGRSNAGKSSLINCIAGGAVAMVSQTPGKTRLLNFFNFGDYYRWVDMPGYGYAARSGDEVSGWHKMVETFLATRGTLRGLVLLMDLRREWEENEELLKKFCNSIELPMILVLTKADKCKAGEQKQRLNALKKASGLSHVFLTSSESRMGVKELEDFLFAELIKPVAKKIRKPKKKDAP